MDFKIDDTVVAVVVDDENCAVPAPAGAVAAAAAKEKLLLSDCTTAGTSLRSVDGIFLILPREFSKSLAMVYLMDGDVIYDNGWDGGSYARTMVCI
mmetsp:Transcript_32697/g.79455  ORF Transcript_32697/g.79455 Transcript_32697/m.79455 type:complete len:96 (+) Transcript_32697:1649-1936(+)